MTENELLEELRRYLDTREAGEIDPRTVTGPEIKEQLGLGRGEYLRLVAELIDNGVLTRTMVRRPSGWGHMTTVKGYRYTGELGGHHDS